jgi:hypothetical protein
VFEIGTFQKPKPEPKINPEKRVANENYFKALKDVKLINGPTKQSEKMISRTRFDQQVSTHTGDDLDDDGILENGKVTKTKQYVDTSLDPKDVIA